MQTARCFPRTIELHLEASICLREGDQAKAAQLLAEAEESRPHPTGTCDGKPFDDLRDLDDLVAPVFEVLTSTGKYYWIPMERVERPRSGSCTPNSLTEGTH